MSFCVDRDVSLLMSSVVPVLEGAVTFFLSYMTFADDGKGKVPYATVQHRNGWTLRVHGFGCIFSTGTEV